MSEGLAHAGALVQLAQLQGAAPRPYTPASWVSYGSSEAVVLAIALLVVASGFACAGNRVRAPVRVARPGRISAGFMIAVWLLAICDVLAATFV
jgi:hypothetical protein